MLVFKKWEEKRVVSQEEKLVFESMFLTNLFQILPQSYMWEMTLRARGDSAEIKQQEGIQNTCQEKSTHLIKI